MTKEMSSDLYSAITELRKQDNAISLIHQIICGLVNSVGMTSAAFIEKSRTDDYLMIRDTYNVSEQVIRAYKRAIGTHIIGRIFYQDEFEVVLKSDSESDYKDIFLEHDFDMAVLLRMSIENRAIGFLVLYFDERFEISDELKSFLIAITAICSEAIRREMMDNLIKDTRTIDPQTGLFYYFYFHQKLKEEFNKSKRTKTPLTVAIIDMDNFKDVMNSHGLETAHSLYKELADELRSHLRSEDIIGRHGTDELILCMPNTSCGNACISMNNFIDAIRDKKFTTHHLLTSIAIGTASLHQDESLEELLHRAQLALYKAMLIGNKIAICYEV
ncbi:MAG: GGDEF domain-containing protein [Nitrospirae bacterium]|nr:GGDEF domain-containing protein [Nitrospirota bacterium]